MSGTNLGIQCGDAMPRLLTSTDVAAYDAEDKRCLMAFFWKIAKTPGTFPCNVGGAGGGGTAGSGGASMSGAGGGAGASTSGAGGT